MLSFEIKHRFSGSVLFTAAIECGPETPFRVQLGLAIKAAVRDGADLRGADLQGADLQGADLQGAYLQGADLRGADLQGAYLQGAYLQGAYLRGAYLRDDHKVTRMLAATERLFDGYTFHLWQMEQGEPRVTAGCRFYTIAEYREHVALDYPGTLKAAETLRILNYFEASCPVAAEAPVSVAA